MQTEVLSRRDVHRAITETIASAIEAGAKEYQMPWHRGTTWPVNACTGKPYHGVNVIALWAMGNSRGFRSGYWATCRQWNQLRARVRKGERGSMVVFYKTVAPTSESPPEQDQPTGEKPRMVARASWVFNADQVEGWALPRPEKRCAVEIREEVEAYIGGTRAVIRHGGDMAYYYPAGDFIAVPDPDQFVATATSSSTEGYYSVILHELTHWSGAPHRLGRNLRARFGDHAYAMEELIAEFGAAFLCAELQIANEPRIDHASYIASWLLVLKEDRMALFTAANKASVAVTYLGQLVGRAQ